MEFANQSNQELVSKFLDMQEKYDELKVKYENHTSQFNLAEQKFRTAMLLSPDSVNINRLSDGMYVSINEGFTALTGYSLNEVVGKTSLDLNIWQNPADRNRLVAELKEKGMVLNFETCFLKKDGTVIDGLMSASLIDLDGEPHLLNVVRDITRIKQVDQELALEQSLMEALMNNLDDFIYMKDRQGRFTRINNSQAVLLGLDDPHHAIGKTDIDFYSDEHSDQALSDEMDIVLTGKKISLEEKLTRKNRSDLWVFTTKMPLLDHSGNIIGTFGISKDITEKKKYEENLNLLASALKSINECVSITDINDNVLFVNKAFVDTYGYTESELKEKSISLIRSPDNSPELVEEILPETLKGGWKGELLNKNKNGNSFLVSLSTSVIKDANNQPFALIGVANDITIKKRRELEARVLFEITQGITRSENLDDLLKLIHNSLGKVVYAENCFVALHDEKTKLFSFPYFVDKFDSTPSPTLMKKSCTAYVFKTNEPFLFQQEEFDKLQEQNEVELVGLFSPSWIGIPLQTPSKVIGVLVLQHYEKENVYSETDVQFLKSVGSQIAISIERKQAEEEIKIKNELLQKVNAEKDKFFSIIAHDLRGPLSAFVAATQILEEDIQNMTLEDIREITLSMNKDATNVYSLLENLLEWSRLQRGVMEFKPAELNLLRIINSGIESVSAQAMKKGIFIDCSVNDNLKVNADIHMFETVVRNLISNSVKFTKPGGKVTISAQKESDGSISVMVADSGIGMSQELLGRLFRINEKTSRPGTSGEPSTGLGLLLCKEFIEKHGGEINVKSEEGTGSTFSFKIPGGLEK
jgi:PAS domain S-box-containing protein